MASRLNLQKELEGLIGSSDVYFQPPASIYMNYPCIRYTLRPSSIRKADNVRYLRVKHYQLIFITEDADTDIPDKILDHFPLSSMSSAPYAEDGLYHYPIDLYY